MSCKSTPGLHTGHTDFMRSQSPVWKRRTLLQHPVGETAVSTGGLLHNLLPLWPYIQPVLLSPSQAPGRRDGTWGQLHPSWLWFFCVQNSHYTEKPAWLPVTCLPWLPLTVGEWGEALSMALLCRFFPTWLPSGHSPDPWLLQIPTPHVLVCLTLPKTAQNSPHHTQLPTLTRPQLQSPFQDTLR